MFILKKKTTCHWNLFMISRIRFPTRGYTYTDYIYIYKVFTRHLNMDCFESAVPAIFLSYAPTFFKSCIISWFFPTFCDWLLFIPEPRPLENYFIILVQKTYNDNVSHSIYLQKFAVLPLVYLNKSCTNTFCRRSYGLKENDSFLFLQNNNTCISCRWFEGK